MDPLEERPFQVQGRDVMERQGCSHAVAGGQRVEEGALREPRAAAEPREPGSGLLEHLRVDVDEFDGPGRRRLEDRLGQGAGAGPEVEHEAGRDRREFPRGGP